MLYKSHSTTVVRKGEVETWSRELCSPVSPPLQASIGRSGSVRQVCGAALGRAQAPAQEPSWKYRERVCVSSQPFTVLC